MSHLMTDVDPLLHTYKVFFATRQNAALKALLCDRGSQMQNLSVMPDPAEARQQPTVAAEIFPFPILEQTDYASCCRFEAEFSREEVSAILEMAGALPVEDARLNADRSYDPEHRVSRVSWLPPSSATTWLYRRLGAIVYNANLARYGYDLRGIYEPLQVAEYRKGCFFDWHLDYGPGPHSIRKLSVTVQLSDDDDYDGGDFELFYSFTPDRAVRRLGTVIIFPSYVLHRVTAVTRGVRRSLVAWVSGPPFR